MKREKIIKAISEIEEDLEEVNAFERIYNLCDMRIFVNKVLDKLL